MAYIVGVETATDSGTPTTFSIPIPAGHQGNDLVIALVNQDTATTTAITAPEGWTEIGTQAAQNAQRAAAFRKVLSSSNEPDLLFTGHAEQWSAVLILVRGAPTTTPINVSARAGVAAGSGSGSWAPGVTTTADNCLVLHAWLVDVVSRFMPLNGYPIDHVAMLAGASTSIFVGSSVKTSAGAVAAAQAHVASQGTAITIAINDDGSGAVAPNCAETNAVFRRLGNFATLESVTFDSLAATGIASIAGVPIDTATPSVQGNAIGANLHFSNIITTTATDGDPGLLTGVSFAVPPTDLSDTAFSGIVSLATQTGYGAQGVVGVLQDSAGAWVAYRLVARRDASASGVARYFVIQPGGPGVLASGGGTIDWTDIVRIGVGLHRIATTAVSRTFGFGSLFLASGVTAVGGSELLPVSTGVLQNMADGWYGNQSMVQQGQRQALIRTSLQFGDGSTTSYVDTSAGSVETPDAYRATLPQYLWMVGDDALEIRVKASASCTMHLGSTVFAAGTRQLFVIDPASSPSADYDFAGAVFVGWRVENNTAGIAINNAVFDSGHRITLNGGLLSDCTVSGAKESPAVLTNEPDNISGSAFIAGPDGGHAIEITAPGTYTFTANTFTGYGADGTTDAAIYNNSGGAVTLNIAGGGDTPTVRNGSGASTTVNSGATLTLTGLIAGSDIVILDAGTTTERVNVDSNAGTTYAYNYTATGDVDIGVFKTGYVPLYVRGFTLTTSDATLPIAQAVDRGYLNP